MGNQENATSQSNSGSLSQTPPATTPVVATSPAKKSINQLHLLIASFLLVSATIVFCYLFYINYKKLDEAKMCVKVLWLNENKLQFKSTPIWFTYDSSYLKTLKQINIEDKQKLLELINQDSVKDYKSYVQAVNTLTFLSNKEAKLPWNLIIIIGGLSAILGVQIRSFYDFINHICYKEDIDLRLWWPWYALRPVYGFLIGGLIIFLVEGKLFNAHIENDELSSFILVGLTSLAGFGITDVIALIRTLSKKIFTSK